MDALYHKLEEEFLYRSELITKLIELIGIDPKEVYPSTIYLHGHSSTGKTAIFKSLLALIGQLYIQLRSAIVDCVECYSSKTLLGSILEELMDENEYVNKDCDNIKEFVAAFRKLDPNCGYIIVLDNAERLREIDGNVLATLLQLQVLTGLNVCVVLVSQLPFEKYYCKTGLSEFMQLYCTQYTKNETLCILNTDLPSVKCITRARFEQQKPNLSISEFGKRLDILEDLKLDFYSNYLNIFLSIFYKACRDVTELKIISRKCFIAYVEPVLNGSIETYNVTRLYRNISGTLKDALTHIYMRSEHSEHVISNKDDVREKSIFQHQVMRKLANSLELPYYGKYLLIAAFLASHNPAKQDKRFFIKNHGKQRKRMQSMNAQAKVTEKMSASLGPKSFNVDRLLAIFYAILDEQVGLTCNMMSQISTLVHLKLLNFISGENNVMDGSSRLQCTVNLDFMLYIGKVVGFNLQQYLFDFL